MKYYIEADFGKGSPLCFSYMTNGVHYWTISKYRQLFDLKPALITWKNIKFHKGKTIFTNKRVKRFTQDIYLYNGNLHTLKVRVLE